MTREPDPVTDPLCDADPLARALAKLRPAPSGLDAQRLLFLAGQAERDQSVTFWRRVSVAQLALLLGLGGVVGVGLMNEPEERGLKESTPAGAYRQSPGPTPQIEPPLPEPPAPHTDSEPYRGIPQGFARRDPDDLSPDDRARWLALRNDVLTAGLGLLPSPVRPFDANPGYYAIPGPQPEK